MPKIEQGEAMVRVDALRPGQRFRCVSGRLWTFERKDGALSGVYWAMGADDRRDCFAGCARVLLLSEPPAP